MSFSFNCLKKQYIILLYDLYPDILEASKDADALIIITEWDIYKTINWQKISKVMRKPSWVFDARGVVNVEEVKSNGINLWQVGNGYSNN